MTVVPQPPPPTLACYETATFNTTTCQWEVSGTQPPQPPLACYETATFNSATCQWEVSGSDTFPPTFTTVEAGGSASAGADCQAPVPNLVDGSEAADVNCPPTAPADQLASVPPDVTISQSPAAGTLVGLGVTSITLTATDGAGNVTTATTSFEVIPGNVPAAVFAYDTYTWPVNGQTYTSSGTYVSAGTCPTTTLLLTIVASIGTTSTATATGLPADFTLNQGQLVAANVRQNGTING
ncbi:MAG: hypothetical protein ACKOET_18440, partial [Verrucomicrobiota bacterium]